MSSAIGSAARDVRVTFKAISLRILALSIFLELNGS